MGVASVIFDIFFKIITVASMKSLGHYQVSHMLLIGCIISLRTSSPKNLSTFPGTLSSSVALLSLISLTSFYTSSYKYNVLSHLHKLLFRFDFKVFWLISSIIKLCHIILPNFQYLFRIYYSIPVIALNTNVLNPMIFFST
jgi:hypothetical protein